MALAAVADGPAVVACSTCRHKDGARRDAAGRTGGDRMVAALRAVARTDPRYAGIAVQSMPCLFACQDACTVHLRGPGRIGYVLGRFGGGEDDARAILEYMVHYAASDDGEVPYRDWPQGVKGHFLTRVPPAGRVVT